MLANKIFDNVVSMPRLSVLLPWPILWDCATKVIQLLKSLFTHSCDSKKRKSWREKGSFTWEMGEEKTVFTVSFCSFLASFLPGENGHHWKKCKAKTLPILRKKEERERQGKKFCKIFFMGREAKNWISRLLPWKRREFQRYCCLWLSHNFPFHCSNCCGRHFSRKPPIFVLHCSPSPALLGQGKLLRHIPFISS